MLKAERSITAAIRPDRRQLALFGEAEEALTLPIRGSQASLSWGIDI